MNKHLFVTLLVVGVLFSWGARFLSDRFWETAGAGMVSVIATAICLLCLVAYYSRCRKADEGRESQNPDNLYYMGFLFTLSSLVYSLITLFLLGEGGDDIEEQVYNLIGSFGIALISTAFGILFRILLLQARHDSVGVLPHATEQDLSEINSRLRQKLDEAIRETIGFLREIPQSSNAMIRETQEAHATVIRETQETHDTVLRQFATATRKLIATVENSEKSLGEAVSASSEKLVRGGAKMETALESVREPLNHIVLVLQTAGKNTHALSLNIQRSGASLADTGSKIESASEALTEATKTLTEATKTLSEVTKTLGGFLAEAAEVTPKYTRQFEESIQTLQREAKEWEKMTAQIRSSLTRVVEAGGRREGDEKTTYKARPSLARAIRYLFKIFKR